MVGDLPEGQQAESEAAWIEIPEASEGRCRTPSLDREMEAEREGLSVAPNASSLQEAPVGWRSWWPWLQPPALTPSNPPQ